MVDGPEVPLLSLLRSEAGNRGLLFGDGNVDAGVVFTLVRDMAYQRASSRKPEAIIREWRGTCSGKHYLLDALFREMGYDSRVMMCTHDFTPENTAHFPDLLRLEVSKAPVPDVHTYVRLQTEAGWMKVDATWPQGARALGMAVNDRFIPGVYMDVACSPVEVFEVPHGVDPQAFKEELIKVHCGSDMDRRDRFIEDMSRWLVESTVPV